MRLKDKVAIVTGGSQGIGRSIAMRYQGQNYEQEVAVPSGTIDDDALASIYADYGGFYEEFYGYRLDGIPIELVQLTVIVSGAPTDLEGELLAAAEEASDVAPRDVFFPEQGFVDTPIRRRAGLTGVFCGSLCVIQGEQGDLYLETGEVVVAFLR